MTAILSAEQLRCSVPSAFATRPYEGMSRRYRFIPTSEVLAMMADQSFHPVKAVQSRSRIDGKQDFTRHMLRLRHTSHLDGPLNEEIPEVVLVNSHDRTSAYRLFSGIFRLICSNGAIVQAADFGSFSIRHSGRRDLYEQVREATSRIMDDMPTIMGRIADWKHIILPRTAQIDFARKAMEMKPNPAISAVQLLTSRRVEDDTDGDGNRDLWRSYNVIEESLFRGGIRGRNARGRQISTRPIKAVDADLRIHRSLWQLAETFGRN